MPTLRGSKLAVIGLLIGTGLAISVYFIYPYMIQTLVYTTYLPLINPLQLYELAWILGTIDLLLNFSFLFSLILWLCVTIIVALLSRNLNNTLSTLSAAVLLPAGTWLLFIAKYLYSPGFSITFLFSFLLWKTLIPLGIIMGLATLITLPFTLYQHQNPPINTMPTTIRSKCSKCGAVYRSQPLICVHCSGEGTMVEEETKT